MDQNLSELKVLIVDDDEFILNLTSRMLNKIGVDQIVTARNGAHALEIIDGDSGDLDIILVDLNMPGMDGIEFLRHLSERNCTAGIMLASGEDRRVLNTVRELAEGHNLNVLGTIAKPISPRAISELLANLTENTDGPGDLPSNPITEEELRAAIHGDELTVFFQPKVSIATGAPVGAEALARWRHADRGLVGPGAFITLAEQSGLIDELTNALFVKAMSYGGDWRVAGLDTKISVNISVDSLTRLDLPEFFADAAAAHRVDPRSVMIEVTESRLMKDILAPLEILTRLRVKGIGLSIDDFGTGYSSMQQLKRIPFTELKIDRAFVCGAARDPDARAILESSITLGKKLDMSLVAEGVETQEDWDLVAELGCDLVQGYFVAKPMPGEEFMAWCEERARER